MTEAHETATQLDTGIDTLLRDPSSPRVVRDGDLMATARLLRDVLPRMHPHFGFEDLLAARLAAARRMQGVTALPEPTPIRPELAATESADLAAATAAERRRRGLVASGAIASGVSLALPIAGAALVVWRRSRSSGGIL
jgi:hypothetical protein